MYHICRNSILSLLLLIPISSNAMSSIKDADLVITIKNSNPCFSYPQDRAVQRDRYAIRSLGVSKSTGAEGAWEITRTSYDKNSSPEPNSVDTCIEYGVTVPNMRVRQPPRQLEFDVPYRANIHLREAPDVGVAYKRDYLSGFCITKNEQGESIIVEATGGGRGEWRCLKPGESANRGFWGWLFGK